MGVVSSEMLLLLDGHVSVDVIPSQTKPLTFRGHLNGLVGKINQTRGPTIDQSNKHWKEPRIYN